MDEPRPGRPQPWPRPDQAGVGGLDRLSPDHWPKLAAYWLAAGFDSGPLRRLAGLQPREKWTAITLMPAALRSIGFDPAPDNQEFVARCQEALDVVQRDMDAAGYGRYRIQARLGKGWPSMVFPALDGVYWGGAEGIRRQTAAPWLLLHAAELTSDTLREVSEIEFPVCAAHGGDPMTPDWLGEERAALVDEVVWWQCGQTGHPLAPVGQLTAEVAKNLT